MLAEAEPWRGCSTAAIPADPGSRNRAAQPMHPAGQRHVVAGGHDFIRSLAVPGHRSGEESTPAAAATTIDT